MYTPFLLGEMMVSKCSLCEVGMIQVVGILMDPTFIVHFLFIIERVVLIQLTGIVNWFIYPSNMTIFTSCI